MQTTNIAWTDVTWNVFRGCLAVSKGCDHCFAAEIAARFGQTDTFRGFAKRAPSGNAYFTGQSLFLPHKLKEINRLKPGTKVFVNSMSDVFYEGFTDEQINLVFDAMESRPDLIFQVLTKRPARMRQYVTRRWFGRGLGGQPLYDTVPHQIWLGISVEDQQRADERILILLNTPARVRWLSVEPLIGPVSIKRWLWRTIYMDPDFKVPNGRETTDRLSWVVVGGESGKQRRPMDLEWARSLQRECAEAGVAFWFKQVSHRRSEQHPHLDGWKWRQFPGDLRLPEYYGSCEGEQLAPEGLVGEAVAV